MLEELLQGKNLSIMIDSIYVDYYVDLMKDNYEVIKELFFCPFNNNIYIIFFPNYFFLYWIQLG